MFTFCQDKAKRKWHGNTQITRNFTLWDLEGGDAVGRQRKCWVDNIEKWMSLHLPGLLMINDSILQKRVSGRGSLLNCPSCPADDPAGQGTELTTTQSTNWFVCFLKEVCFTFIYFFFFFIDSVTFLTEEAATEVCGQGQDDWSYGLSSTGSCLSGWGIHLLWDQLHQHLQG